MRTEHANLVLQLLQPCFRSLEGPFHASSLNVVFPVTETQGNGCPVQCAEEARSLRVVSIPVKRVLAARQVVRDDSASRVPIVPQRGYLPAVHLLVRDRNRILSRERRGVCIGEDE